MKNYPLLNIWTSDIAKYCIDDDLAQPEIGWNEKGVQGLISDISLKEKDQSLTEGGCR